MSYSTLSLDALLTDIFGVDKRVSEVLTDFGLGPEHINVVLGEHSEDFCANVKFALECRLLHYKGGSRLLDILCRRYGLFGCKLKRLRKLANQWN